MPGFLVSSGFRVSWGFRLSSAAASGTLREAEMTSSPPLPLPAPDRRVGV
jgi:hypothetical protein